MLAYICTYFVHILYGTVAIAMVPRCPHPRTWHSGHGHGYYGRVMDTPDSSAQHTLKHATNTELVSNRSCCREAPSREAPSQIRIKTMF